MEKNILVFFGRIYISFFLKKVGCSVHSKYWLFGAATYELDRFTEFLPILMTSHTFSSLCHLPIVYIYVTVLPILNKYSNYEIITTVGPCIVRPKYPKKSPHYAKPHYVKPHYTSIVL